MDKKNLIKSKTFWFNLFMAILPLVSNHPQEHVVEFGVVWSVLSMALRLFTKDKVVLID